MASTDWDPKQEQAEQLLRQAHLHQMRKQWAAAEQLCRQALELCPSEPTARELMADLYAEKGELDQALEQYRRLFEEHPEREALEEKIARLVLRKDREVLERLEVEQALSNPRRHTAQKRNATVALLLSTICAGAGQIFNGEHVKGLIILVSWVLCLGLGTSDFLKFGFGLMGLPAARPNDVLVVFGFIAVLIYIYSLLDVASKIGRLDRDSSR